MKNDSKLTPSSIVKRHGKKVATSALIAATSLLGTALGVSSAVAGKGHAGSPSAHSAVGQPQSSAAAKTKPYQPHLVFKFKLVAVKTISRKTSKTRRTAPQSNVTAPRY
jgi:hypothetical protein